MKLSAAYFIVILFVEVGDSNSLRTAPINSVFHGAHVIRQSAIKENLVMGVQLALENCREQFKWDRWNCPETVFSRRGRGSAMHSTKEFAYVLSIMSASLTYVITRNCSTGKVEGCVCGSFVHDVDGENEMVGKGCSHYTDYGERMSKKYLDEMEIGTDALAYMNLHNYEIGRQVVRKSLKKRCKCHGLSGSCTVKSCWMELPPFGSIAYQLRKRYERALRIDFEEGKIAVGNSLSSNTLSEIPKIDLDQLIYLQESPNYCLANNTTGWKGTLGRACSKEHGPEVTASERKSCRHLCRKCGHSVRKTKRNVVHHCNCIFKWCCEVKCDTCSKIVTEHFCA